MKTVTLCYVLQRSPDELIEPNQWKSFERADLYTSVSSGRKAVVELHSNGRTVTAENKPKLQSNSLTKVPRSVYRKISYKLIIN